MSGYIESEEEDDDENERTDYVECSEDTGEGDGDLGLDDSFILVRGAINR